MLYKEWLSTSNQYRKVNSVLLSLTVLQVVNSKCTDAYVIPTCISDISV